MAETVTTGNALGLKYTVKVRTGAVGGSETSYHTTDHVSYDQGRTIRESTTTSFRTVYLIDDEGTEHSVVFTNMQVPAREGHRLSAFLLLSGNKNSGYYFAAYNHNTRDYLKSGTTARQVMFPWIIFWVLMAVYTAAMINYGNNTEGNSLTETLVVTALGGLAVGVILWVLGWILSFLRGGIVCNDGKYKRYLKSLKESSGNKG